MSDILKQIVEDEGTISIRKRPDSKRLAAIIQLTDTPSSERDFFSTGETALDKAESKARKRLQELHVLYQHEISPANKSFEFVASQWVKQFKHKNQKQEREYKALVERYFIAYFGKKKNYPINEITPKIIKEYKAWRKVYWTTGPGAPLLVDGKPVARKIEYERGGKTLSRNAVHKEAGETRIRIEDDVSVEIEDDVSVEIVLYEAYFPGVWEVDVRQVLERLGVVHGGAAIRHLDAAPTFQRGEHHEKVGRAVAFVFVIGAGRLPFFHRNRPARFGDKLLRCLIETDKRAILVAWPRVNSQHVLHGRYERTVGLGRDHPLFF